MAVLSNTVSSLADVAKRDTSGKTGGILEILNRSNPVIDEMLVRECNDGDGHKTTVRTGIPRAAWRLLNYGVPQVKTTTAAVRDTTGMLEAYAEVDKKLAEKAPEGQKAWRMSEATGIMEGMSQQMAETVFYGNTDVNPERFLGFTPRYSTKNLANADSAANVIDMGGVNPANNCSAWLVTWGERESMGIYPKGSIAGLHHEDLGEHTLRDQDGGQYQGYRDHFEWDLGLSVRDWRHNVRICNIDTTQLGNTAYLKNLITSFINASELPPIAGEDANAAGSKRVWYVPRPVRNALRFAILNQITYNLTWENFMGKRVVMFDGIPVRRVDALLTTEAVVV